MLARGLIVTSFLVTAIVPASAQAGFSDHCPDGKALPFAALEVKHPLDATCGIKGKPTSPAPSQTQNQVKNDFCRPADAPESFTPQTFIDLEHNSKKIKSGTG